MNLTNDAQRWALNISLLLLGTLPLGGTALGTPTPTEETATPSSTAVSPTPTQDGATPPPLGVFTPGELELSELMIAPAGTSNGEWVELRSLTGTTRTLAGCFILSAADSGESATCTQLSLPGSCSAITVQGAEEILGGQSVFLERNSYISDGCGIQPYGSYAFAVSLSNGDPETLSIHCPGEGEAFQEVAAFHFDWESYNGSSGQSVAVDPDNSSLSCLSPQESPFCTLGGSPNYGSPGAANPSCPQEATPTPSPSPTGPTPVPTPTPTTPSAPHPSAGEFSFTELMVGPATGTSSEWVELKNLADTPRWLGGCYLLRESSSISSTCDTLGITGGCSPIEGSGGLVPEGGDYVLLERDTKLSDGCGTPVDGRYDSSITLGNSLPETLSLYCPSGEDDYERVAEVAYDFASSGAERGQSLSLDPVTGLFCPASTLEAPFCTVGDEEDYGSPGSANPECPEDVTPTDPPTPTPEGTPPEALRPAPGDLIFNELMIAPNGSSTAEYVEVLNTQGEGRWLGGCYLVKTGSEITTECEDLGIPGRCAPLDGAGRLVIPGDDIALFARGSAFADTCGILPDATYGSAVSLSNSDEETLSLLCPQEESGEYETITSLTYEWDTLGGENGQSIGFDSALDPADALFPDDYCLASTDDEPVCLLGDGAPNYGSPGEINPPCPEPDPIPGVGDVVLSELMIAPLESGREWMELEVITPPGDGAWNLKGCQLIEGDCEGLNEGQFCLPESLCEEDNCGGNWSDPQTFSGDVLLSADEPTVIAKSGTCIAGSGAAVEEDEDCLQDAAGTYSTISLTNSAPGILYLLCPAGSESAMEVVDRVTYDWSRDEVGCNLEGNNGCSYSLRPEVLESASPASANDEADAWCVSGSASAYFNEKGATTYGTPGAPNLCADASCVDPASISLVFSEVLIGPIPSSYSNAEGVRVHEWFEWVNTGEEADLSCCYLEVISADDRGDVDARPSQFSLQGTAPVAAGSREVWADSGCLISERVGDEEFCLDDERTNVSDVRAYSGLSFSNSSPQFLSLYCGAPGGRVDLIDEFLYDYAILPTPEGRSYQLTEDSESASANDDSSNWCGAPLTEEGIYVTTQTGPNFGSPGAANTCAPQGETGPGVAGCTCRLDTIQGEGTELRATFTALILMFLGFGLRRRRP